MDHQPATEQSYYISYPLITKNSAYKFNTVFISTHLVSNFYQSRHLLFYGHLVLLCGHLLNLSIILKCCIIFYCLVCSVNVYIILNLYVYVL